MTPEKVREIIEQAGRGDNLTQKVKDVAVRIPCAESAIWNNYLKTGVPARSKAIVRGFQRLAASRGVEIKKDV